MSDLLLRPVAELAELVRSGALSARELVETSLTRIDELEPTINAFTHVASESALAIAGEIGPGDPRPFAGVPIAIKDNRAGRGDAADDGQRHLRRPGRRATTRTWSDGCATRAS